MGRIGAQQRADRIKARRQVMANIDDSMVEAMLGLIEEWRMHAARFDAVGEDELPALVAEYDRNVGEVYDECASRLYFILAPLDPNIDTESSASRQNFIDTGEYLGADKDDEPESMVRGERLVMESLGGREVFVPARRPVETVHLPAPEG
jgi:hypothetical protein